MTQSKKNLEKHISGLRNLENGRLLIDQRGRRWSADAVMFCKPGERLSQKLEWPGRAQTDKRPIGSTGGTFRPRLHLRQLISSALLQPAINQPSAETDSLLWHHVQAPLWFQEPGDICLDASCPFLKLTLLPTASLGSMKITSNCGKTH